MLEYHYNTGKEIADMSKSMDARTLLVEIKGIFSNKPKIIAEMENL